MKNKLLILVSGTGKMGSAVMQGIQESLSYDLPSMAISADPAESIMVGDICYRLIKIDKRESAIGLLQDLERKLLIIDVVPADQSQTNAEFYAQQNLPSIIMSTGISDVSKLKNVLILPNACLHILAFELFLKETQIDLSGDEYKLDITESHQEGKKDKSGTAIKFVPLFNAWGLKFSNEQIYSIRDHAVQVRFIGIPSNFLTGHAYHRYSVFAKKSDDTKLQMLFDSAKQFLINNSLFASLEYFEDTDSITNDELHEKKVHSILWTNDMVDETYSSFMFGLSFVEYENGWKECRFEHTILGRQPYVDGILKYAIPFMEAKINSMPGLNGKNHTTQDLYNWAMFQTGEFESIVKE